MKEKSLSPDTTILQTDNRSDSGFSDTSTGSCCEPCLSPLNFETKKIGTCLMMNIDDFITSDLVQLPSTLTPVEKVLWKDPLNFYKICVATAQDIYALSQKRFQLYGLKGHPDFAQDIYKHYPDGFLVAKRNDNDAIIGSILAINFPKSSCDFNSSNFTSTNKEDLLISSGGMFCVDPEFRNKGIGGKLWQTRANYIGPDRILSLNAVESRIKPNEKLGLSLYETVSIYRNYKLSAIQLLNFAKNLVNAFPSSKYLCQMVEETNVKNCNNTNTNNEIFMHKITGDPDSLDSERLCPQHLWDSLCEFDAQIHYGSERREFLKSFLLTHSHTHTVALFERKQTSDKTSIRCLGYGVLRPRYVGYTISPLYAAQSQYAAQICSELCNILATKILSSNNIKCTPKNTSNELYVHNLTATESIPNGHLSEEPITYFDITFINHGDKTIKNHNYLLVKNLISDLNLECDIDLYRMYSKEYLTLQHDKIYMLTSSEAFIV